MLPCKRNCLQVLFLKKLSSRPNIWASRFFWFYWLGSCDNRWGGKHSSLLGLAFGFCRHRRRYLRGQWPECHGSGGRQSHLCRSQHSEGQSLIQWCYMLKVNHLCPSMAATIEDRLIRVPHFVLRAFSVLWRLALSCSCCMSWHIVLDAFTFSIELESEFKYLPRWTGSFAPGDHSTQIWSQIQSLVSMQSTHTRTHTKEIWDWRTYPY